jgi:hypothetical protein
VQKALTHSVLAEQVTPAAFFDEHLKSASRKRVDVQELHLPLPSHDRHPEVCALDAQQRLPTQVALSQPELALQIAPVILFAAHLESAMA